MFINFLQLFFKLKETTEKHIAETKRNPFKGFTPFAFPL